MTSLVEAEQAIRAARAVAPDVPVVVMMTVDEEGNCLDGSSAEDCGAEADGARGRCDWMQLQCGAGHCAERD